MFSHKTCCILKPFGYRVAHHGYLLTSCLGHSSCTKILTRFTNSAKLVFLFFSSFILANDITNVKILSANSLKMTYTIKLLYAYYV